MPSWAWLSIAVVVLAYVVATLATRRRHRRAEAIVWIPEKGAPTVQLETFSGSSDDLINLALCYASKVQWLMASEPPVIQQVFRDMFLAVARNWNAPGADLIDRVPEAAAIRADSDSPKAVDGGEVYRISFFRTDYKALENRTWVVNSIPKQSLAVNPPWSAIVLLNAIFARLDQSDRRVLGEAWKTWCGAALGEVTEQSAAGLKRLLQASAESTAEARSGRPTSA